jgi:hypothetical protein
VRGRADSPAHHVEQLECAVHLLDTCRISMPPSCTHLDLRSLLASGIPVDLPDGKRLVIGILRPNSTFVGKLAKEIFPVGEKEELEVIAIFRQGHTLLPHAAVILEAEDRLLAIATPAAWEKLEEHFSPFSFAGQGPYTAGS